MLDFTADQKNIRGSVQCDVPQSALGGRLECTLPKGDFDGHCVEWLESHNSGRSAGEAISSRRGRKRPCTNRGQNAPRSPLPDRVPGAKTTKFAHGPSSCFREQALNWPCRSIPIKHKKDYVQFNRLSATDAWQDLGDQGQVNRLNAPSALKGSIRTVDLLQNPPFLQQLLREQETERPCRSPRGTFGESASPTCCKIPCFCNSYTGICLKKICNCQK